MYAKPEGSFTNGNPIICKSDAMVGLRPDRGGSVGIEASYLGRNEDSCVFMAE
jgi:hypothetical protein